MPEEPAILSDSRATHGVYANGYAHVERELASAQLTTEDVLRAAESIQSRSRSEKLIMLARPSVLGAYSSASNPIPEPVKTIEVPWGYVEQIRRANRRVVYPMASTVTASALGSINFIQSNLVPPGVVYQYRQYPWGWDSITSSNASSGHYVNADYGSTLLNAQVQQTQLTYNYLVAGLLDILGHSQQPETQEQREARLKVQAEYEAKRKAAAQRAEQLMFTILKPEQVRQYQDHGYFETEVSDRIYRIKKGRAQNIEQIVNGKPILRLCAHPSEWMPDADNMVAQFLMLRTDEAKFLATANKTRLIGHV